jgi:hypothetical protein
LPPDTTAFTLEAWVTTFAQDQVEQDIFRQADSFLLRIDPYSEGGSFSFFVFENGQAEPRANSGVFAAPGTRYFIAATFDDNILNIYVDGKLRGQSIRTGNLTIANEPLILGNGFNGTIADARIYGRALTAGEVTAQFDNRSIDIGEYAEPFVSSNGALITVPLDSTFEGSEIGVIAARGQTLSCNTAFEFRVYQNQDLVYKKDIPCNRLPQAFEYYSIDSGFSVPEYNSVSYSFQVYFEGQTDVYVYYVYLVE